MWQVRQAVSTYLDRVYMTRGNWFVAGSWEITDQLGWVREGDKGRERERERERRNSQTDMKLTCVCYPWCFINCRLDRKQALDFTATINENASHDVLLVCMTVLNRQIAHLLSCTANRVGGGVVLCVQQYDIVWWVIRIRLISTTLPRVLW